MTDERPITQRRLVIPVATANVPLHQNSKVPHTEAHPSPPQGLQVILEASLEGESVQVVLDLPPEAVRTLHIGLSLALGLQKES